MEPTDGFAPGRFPSETRMASPEVVRNLFRYPRQQLLEQSIRDSAAELEKMVDHRTAELRRLSGRLMTVQDEERRRIARELHDGLGQELVAAKLMVRASSASRSPNGKTA